MPTTTGHAVALHVLEVADEVGRALADRGDVLDGEVILADAAMHLERPHRRHHHRGVGPEPGHPALDVEEFLPAEIGPEAGLGDDEVTELQPGAGRHHRIAAMGDVGEGAAMDEGGVALDGLDEVRRQRVLEEHRHRAVGGEVARGDRLPVAGLGDDDPAQPLDQVVDAGRRGRRSPSLRRRRRCRNRPRGESRWRRRRARRRYSRSARSFMSTTRRQVTRRWSMPSALPQ